MKESAPQRILWVDFAKFIGIWLVVLGHMGGPAKYVIPIFSFHMPLFFFISGYLERDRNIKDTFFHALQTLIIPYVILYWLGYFLWNPIESVLHFSILKYILGMIFGVGYNTDFSIIVDVPLWFLIGLFVVKMLHSIISSLVRKFSQAHGLAWLIANIIIIGLVLLIKQSGHDLYFSIDSAFLAYPFFSIGYMARKYLPAGREMPPQNISKIIRLLIISLSFVLVILFSNYNGMVDINGFEYGSHIWVFYLNAFIGILLIICLSSFYSKEIRLLSIISEGTVIILAFHNFAVYEFFRVFYYLFPTDIILMRYQIAMALAIVLLMALPIIFVQKYFPIIMGNKSNK